MREPTNFRDPCGFVVVDDSEAIRGITSIGVSDFDFVEATGLLQRLVADRVLWPFSEASPVGLPDHHGFPIARALAHPKLPFVSFPYEWCFSALKAAALAHLDVQIEALSAKVSIKDASPYNIQFVGTRPVFIDHLSFQPYREGEYWVGHHQFFTQFFIPLLLESHTGQPVSFFYRASPDGITGPEALRLLPRVARLRPAVLMNLVLPNWLASRETNRKGVVPTRRPLPQVAYAHLLKATRSAVQRLKPTITETTWTGYACDNSYSPRTADAKRTFVHDVVAAAQPRQVWDLGCNTGEYARVALGAGAASVIGFDGDAGAVDQAFRAAARRDEAFLPLVVDLASPSPGIGWRNRERPPLLERKGADFVLGLALVHHLALGRNVPLAAVVDLIMGIARQGIIEFVPVTDPMADKLMAGRGALFSAYTEEAFREAIARRGQVLREQRLPDSDRLLVHFQRMD